jgi:hypothetical protein
MIAPAAARDLTSDLVCARGGEVMDTVTYDKELTALLVIDPYNDFISEGGKVWDRLRPVARTTTVSLPCCRS